MGAVYKQLNITERRTIEDLLHRKTNVTEIARRINRHRSTVYREIKRNFYKDEELPQLDGYYGMNAKGSRLNVAQGVANWCEYRRCEML